ncbi:MAG: glycosyltransferase family 2 protein [Chitinophagaceae bacterium]|nr:MAG: glycosyltransferase family 2 protein [Chitinophagaceae bacterium]
MNSEPLVSVLMTAYNREKFIASAIESVLASNYKNFELIIVDDGSTDRTIEIAKAFGNSDPRIRVYLNEKNLGDYFNRNKAASYAKGKYIKYLDSDDLIYPHGLGVMVLAMEKFPDAAVGISTGSTQDRDPFPYQLAPREAYLKNFFEQGIFNTGPSGLIFRRDHFDAIGGFSGIRYIGDAEINLRLAASAPVVVMGPALIYWRIHEGQEFTAGLTGTGYLELSLPMLRRELAKPECPLTKTEVEDVLTHYRKVYSRRLINLALKQKQPGKALELKKTLSLGAKDLLRSVLFMNRALKQRNG